MISYSIHGSILAEQGLPFPFLGASALAICSSCGAPWLRIEVAAREWRGVTLACPACPPWPFDDSIPGSILTLLGTDALDYLPDAVLAHELQMHLAFWERKNHE